MVRCRRRPKPCGSPLRSRRGIRTWVAITNEPAANNAQRCLLRPVWYSQRSVCSAKRLVEFRNLSQCPS
jgi:hypothetical protein